MHPFPPTASLPNNVEYDAAIDVLHRHRLERCADDSCFTLPASAIQGAARISGSDVRRLLRSKASKAIVHPDDSRSPWMEIIGVYTFRSEVGSCAVLAISISSQSLIEKLLLMSESDPMVAVNTEKIRLVDKASNLLRKFLSSSADMHDKLFSEDLEQFRIRQDYAMRRLKQVAVSRSEVFGGNADQDLQGGMFFVCDRLDPDSLRKFIDHQAIPILQVSNLPEFMKSRLIGWRALFGTGWLNGLDNFLNDLESALRSKQLQDHVHVNHATSMRGGPAELAVVAAAKLVTHGWLPQQYSSSSTAAGAYRVIKRFMPTSCGAMTDGDISVFELPRFIFPGEHELQLKTPEERMRSTRGLFQTPFSQDDVFLYFDHSGYGEREKDVLDFQGPDRANRKMMPIGFLRPISLGVLRCLLPAVRIDIIGYSAAASTTTRSAVIERMLRLISLQPSNSDHLGNLRDEVSNLLTPSEMKQPNYSTHTRCMVFDGLIQAYQSADASECSSCADTLPESWPKKLLQILLMSGRGNKTPVSEVFSSIVMLSSLLFQVPVDQLKPLILSGNRSPSREVDLILALYKLISLAAKDDPDIRRTQGSPFNHLALRKQMVIMIRDAVKGRLAVPDLLAEWITKHVRITCVMPLDPIHTGLLPTPKPGRPALAGSFQSSRLYKHLFHPEAVKSAIEVDLTTLLDHAFRSLVAGKGESPGWLANKISQTNELMVNMMVQTGHLEDFPSGELLSPKTAKNSRSMLSALPAHLLVRCILGESGGRECLDHWAEDISEKVARYWRDDIAGSAKKSPVLSSDSAAILEVFRDVEGVATAALDCCRRRFIIAGEAKQGDMRVSVYFLPDELRNQFRKPMLTKSLGVRSVQKR